MSGWVAIRREMHEHPIFKGQPLRVAAWTWMLAKAAWKDTRQDAGGKSVTIARGQLLTSYRQMSEATGVGAQVLRTLVSRLQAERAIDTDINTGRLLITIRNYDKYQRAPEAANTPANTGATQQQHTKEQENKRTTEEEAKASLSAAADERAAVTLFNAYAERQGWPQVRSLSAKRKAALRSRLRECGGLDGWRGALDRAAASDLCNGVNDRGWLCNFDFLTRQSSFAKLIEGNFDNRKTTKGMQDAPKRSKAADAAAQWRARGMGSGQGGDPSQPLLPAGHTGGSGDGGDRGLDRNAGELLPGFDQPRLRIVSP